MTRRHYGAGAFLLCALLGCTAPIRPGAPPDGPVPPPQRVVAEGVPLAHAADVRAVLKASSRAPYLVDAVGGAGQLVAVRLTNAGTRRVDVDHFRLTLTATRAGVPFPCRKQGVAADGHEPSSLIPSQSFVFHRELDCTMPLPGRYDVAVYVALRDAGYGDRGDFVGSFALEIEDGPSAPRPYAARPGLYVTMVGGRVVRPLPQAAWERGDYHVVLGLVNGSNRPVRVGPGRLAFLTYRGGSPLPCSGQAEAILLPDELAPGAMHVVQARVACVPPKDGRYEIVGRLALGALEEVEVGRVALEVTRDPLLFAPDPGPTLPSRPETWLK